MAVISYISAPARWEKTGSRLVFGTCLTAKVSSSKRIKLIHDMKSHRIRTFLEFPIIVITLILIALIGANLSETNLIGANLTGADITGAIK